MTNHLAECSSLYLRKHAENPIDWWYWCDEALATALAEDKPIFLSIGYSSCHWCTVMEGEAFSNEAIAEYMNANFLPIKVDREERPDIDSIYMQALQMLNRQGGWPLNIFLTPGDLVPFYGGTYFPLEPRYNLPGFLEVLKAVRGFYDEQKEKLQSLKTEIVNALQQGVVLPTATGDSLNQELLHQGMETSAGIIGRNDFGSPSFPMIPYANLALRSTRLSWESSYDPQQVTIQRGMDLALGGIFDHVGGGFHRYTVDATWTVPHFEKMLYDNGQIMEYLANLWSMGVKEPAFSRAIAQTVKWLRREMRAPEGYFYAAQDADSFTTSTEFEPEEGAFYVWDYAPLEEILTPEELTALQQELNVTPEGNFEGSNVLQRLTKGKLSDTVEDALAKLFKLRYGVAADALETFPPASDNQAAKQGNWQGRIPPVTDTKMIVAWNSLMISGLARAGEVFGQLSYGELARDAALFILNNQWINGRLHRLNYAGKASTLAQSEDYALLIKALLDLHQASLVLPSLENNWLAKAVEVQEEFEQFLWSVELGGYYNAPHDASSNLLVRERSYIDNATPAPNGIAIANLVRLWLLTEKEEYLAQVEQGLLAFSSAMTRMPQACPSLFTALDWYLNPTLVRTNSEYLRELIIQYLPHCAYQLGESLPDRAVGLVCQGVSCQEPAQSFAKMLAQISDTKPSTTD